MPSSAQKITEPASKKTEKQASETKNRNQNQKTQQRRNAVYGWIFLSPFAVLFLLVFLIPIGVSIYKSFFRSQVDSSCGLYGCGTGAVDTFVGFQNFSAVLSSSVFWHGMGRVFLFGIIQIPIMILLALALALLLDSIAAHFQRFYRLTYFLPYAIPGVIAAIVWIFLYQPGPSPIIEALGYLGVHPNFFNHSVVLLSMANVTTWTYTGYNMLIFYAALQAVPPELYEAARIDGANEWTIARQIKVPMLAPAALLAVLLSIIGTIQLFNEPAMFQKAASLPSDYMPMMMALNVKNGTASLAGATGDGPAAAISLVMAIVAGILALGYAFIQAKVAPSEN